MFELWGLSPQLNCLKELIKTVLTSQLPQTPIEFRISWDAQHPN